MTSFGMPRFSVKFLTILLYLFPALFFSLPVNAASVVLNLGEQEITVIYPQEYVNACKNSDELYQGFSLQLLTSYVLIACFLQQEELDRYAKSGMLTDSPHLWVQTVESLEGRDLTKQQFDQYRLFLEKSQKDMINNLEPTMKGIVGKTPQKISAVLAELAKSKFVQIVPLGAYSITDNNVAIAYLRLTEKKAYNGANLRQAQVVATNFILKDGKLLGLAVAKSYRADSDLEIVKDMALNWGSEN